MMASCAASNTIHACGAASGQIDCEVGGEHLDRFSEVGRGRGGEALEQVLRPVERPATRHYLVARPAATSLGDILLFDTWRP